MKKPKNYYSHKQEHLDCEVDRTKWDVIEKIGEGAFGSVFKLFNKENSSIEVIKLPKTSSTTTATVTTTDVQNSMKKEHAIMREMSGSHGFARVKEQEDQSMVMTLLGSSLDKCRAVSVVSMKRIAYQSVQRLRELHAKGYIHRDLKPENIMLGNHTQPHTVFLVDFGLAVPYRKGVTAPRKLYNGEVGTIRFCSRAAHAGLEQFPKDDLESLGYVLAWMVLGQLPWSKVDKSLPEETKYSLVRDSKVQSTVQDITAGISCLSKYFGYVRALHVSTPIDYEKMLGWFDIPCREADCYDFCTGKCPVRL